uniref:Uncharacterized protein n=1 Tax=Zea mays TaxID=4577 RepID=A0A804MW10_MAIZE
GQRQGQPVFISKLESWGGTVSRKVAEDWPETMQIVRLIAQEHMNKKYSESQYVGNTDFLIFRALNQHGFLGQLQERKLCGVIQLPSQTLLLSMYDKTSRMVGMLFPKADVQARGLNSAITSAAGRTYTPPTTTTTAATEKHTSSSTTTHTEAAAATYAEATTTTTSIPRAATFTATDDATNTTATTISIPATSTNAASTATVATNTTTEASVATHGSPTTTAVVSDGGYRIRQ